MEATQLVAARLITPRLVLQPLQVSDADSLCRLFADRSFSWYPYRRARSTRECHQFLDDAVRHWEKHGIGRFAIRARDDDTLLGYTGVTTLVWPHRASSWDLGFRLARTARGAGIGSEAARATRDDAFRRTPAATLTATAETGNVSARRLLAALGFRETEEMIHPLHGTPHVVAELIRPDRIPSA